MEDFLIACCVAGTVLGTAEMWLRRTSFWTQRLVWITTVMTTEAVKLVSIMCQSLRDVLYIHT